jgi:uncharacterized membrane protein
MILPGETFRCGAPIQDSNAPHGSERYVTHDRFGESWSKEARRVILFRGAETHTRSILKAVSWRTLGTLDTFAISWFFTGKVEVAGSIAGLEIVTKIVWYYLHERVWAAVPWGRR